MYHPSIFFLFSNPFHIPKNFFVRNSSHKNTLFFIQDKWTKFTRSKVIKWMKNFTWWYEIFIGIFRISSALICKKIKVCQWFSVNFISFKMSMKQIIFIRFIHPSIDPNYVLKDTWKSNNLFIMIILIKAWVRYIMSSCKTIFDIVRN